MLTAKSTSGGPQNDSTYSFYKWTCLSTTLNFQESRRLQRIDDNFTSYHVSQLEQPSYPSNPLQMDKNNLPSLHLDAGSLLAPSRVRRRHLESPSSQPFSPASFTPRQMPTPTYISFTISISVYPYQLWRSISAQIFIVYFIQPCDLKLPVQITQSCCLTIPDDIPEV